MQKTVMKQSYTSLPLFVRCQTVWVLNPAINMARTSKWSALNKRFLFRDFALCTGQDSAVDSRTWPHRCSDIFRVRVRQKHGTQNLFSLQKDVELVCGFILSSLSFVHRKFCLPCWRTSQHKSLSLFSVPITLRSSRCSAVWAPICPYKGRQACRRTQCGSMLFVIFQLSNDGRQEQTRTSHHNSPLHCTSMALCDEDTPLE